MPSRICSCSGDSCYAIEQATRVTTLAELPAWSTDVNSAYTDLYLDYFICIGASQVGRWAVFASFDVRRYCSFFFSGTIAVLI